MEVQDILMKRLGHPQLELDQAAVTVSSKQTQKLQEDFLAGRPFAYLTNHAEFYHHQFYINEDVLIPRPETELLVDLLVQDKRRFEKVLDVGTGSGVILLSLLDQGVAQAGMGVDISAEALAVTQINARRLRLEERLKLVMSDRFTHVHEKFDLIVSNPPYIKASAQRHLVHQGVENHEPHLALYLGDEHYDNWFHGFFLKVAEYLEPGGLFLMEGHELELEGQGQMLKELGFEQISVLQDFAGLPRFLRALRS